jgi:hypothetical protein
LILLEQGLIAVEIEPGRDKLCFIARKVGAGLVQRQLVGARVDLREHLALADHLPFLEQDLEQHAGKLVRTVAVTIGCTVPSAATVTGMSAWLPERCSPLRADDRRACPRRSWRSSVRPAPPARTPR